jgi:putative membrane protein
MGVKYAVVAAVVALSGVALAQAGQQQAQELSDQEKMVLNQLHSIGQAEIQLGQMAQQKSRTPAIQQYGQRLVQEHERAGQRLTQTAEQLEVELEERPVARDDADQRIIELHQNVMETLEQLPPEQFDSLFLASQVAMHDRAINQISESMGQVRNPQVRQLATAMLPSLQQHRQQAHRLLGQQAATGRARRGPAGR